MGEAQGMAARILRGPGARQGSDDGSGGIEDRLRAVELDVRELKTSMKHMATRAWVLSGILGGMGVAAGVALAVFRLLGPGSGSGTG